MPKKSENILLITITPGDLAQNRIALIPSHKLPAYKSLDNINGKIVNIDNMSDAQNDRIVKLYERLGIETTLPEKDQDLKKYLDPKPPFSVDKVITIGWAI